MIHKERVPLLQMLTIGMLPSALKVAYYRSRGAKIGRGVSIGFFTVIIAEVLEIGDGSSIGFGTILRGKEIRIRRHVKIGSMTFMDVEKIFIDDDAKINEQVFAGGPMLPESYLHIGKNTIVMQYTFLNATKPLIIGDGTGVGGHCLLFTHGSWQSQIDGFPVTFAPITLGKNVWLPWRVFILPGVTVGDDVTIGANSLVTKSIPAGSLAAGVPAKVLKGAPDWPGTPTPDDRRRILEEILGEAFRYIEYHGYKIDRLVTPDKWEVQATGKGKTHKLLYFPGAVQPSAVTATGTAILSLAGVAGALPVKTDNMWIDIAAKSRTGSTEFGEELVLFLSRYGVRFYRAD